MATARRLFPGMKFMDVADLLESPPPEQPDIKKQFLRARIVVKGEMDEQILPTFMPSSTVASTNVFGHEVYQKCGLMTAEQVSKHFQKTPQQLGMEVFSTPNQKAGQEQNFYAISLEDCPDEVYRSLRKCKVFFARHCSHAENWLTPQTQLMTSQGPGIFEYVFNDKYAQTRPGKVATQNLQTFTYWAEVGQKLENAMASALAQAKEDQSGMDDEDVPVNEEAVKRSEQAMEAMGGFSEGFQTEATKLKRRKLMAKETKAVTNQRGQKGAPSKTSAAMAAIENDADTKSQSARGSVSGSKKDQDVDNLLRTLDPDMKKVAECHLSTGKTNSAKSLVHLKVSNFFDKDGPQVKTHTLPSAAWLVEFLLRGW